MAFSNHIARLNWPSVPQRVYRVEASSNFLAWTPLATNLVASATNYSWTGTVSAPWQFFRVERAP